MRIGGLEKLSLIDYPGEVSAVVFTIGCTFRCPFCYNPMLVLSVDRNGNSSLPMGQESEKGHTLLNEDDLFLFLKSRQGKLDAVVITGGEPTMHSDLPEFIARLKAMGFKVKLDTNGTNPAMLKKLITAEAIDYLAMDLKAAPADYTRATGRGQHLRNNLPAVSAPVGLKTTEKLLKVLPYSSSSFGCFGTNGIQNADEAISEMLPKFDFNKIRESVKLIMASGLPYEFRTTCVPGFMDEQSMAKMGELIKNADKWYLQNFKSDTALIDMSLHGKPGFSSAEMEKLASIGRQYVKKCEVRG